MGNDRLARYAYLRFWIEATNMSFTSLSLYIKSKKDPLILLQAKCILAISSPHDKESTPCMFGIGPCMKDVKED